MRLTRIRIRGYKRLADASCNVDGRLIALVGPNEAGKSSVLEALAWLSAPGSGPLERPMRSRSLGDLADTAPVVDAKFTLDDDDRAVLSDLQSDVVPHSFTVRKRVDGKYTWFLEPLLTTRRAPLDAAATAVSRLEERFPSLFEATEEEDGPLDWIDALERGLGAPDSDERGPAVEAAANLVGWLRRRGEQSGTSARLRAALSACATKVEAAIPLLTGDAPHQRAGSALWKRRPEFLLFREGERVLQTEYNLDDARLLAETPPALENLLTLGGTSIQAIVDERQGGDVTRMSTLVKGINRALSERLQPTWRQAALTVAIDVDGSALRLLVDEVTGDARTAIHERSDGLKTFIALVCFLARHRSDVPPVLMLDEAETHLHYDAQADLVDVLTSHVATNKVIYTTHSPGCLPPDLGTGVRLVAPEEERPVSVLRNNFWESNEPGFSPLLFAMGAGAAAFSVCRRAVLVEGPSDMILMPTLLRRATGLDELGYQVAPGLSAASTADLVASTVAARMAYLVDGDGGGRGYQANLIRAGVDEARVLSLPQGAAVEDLVAQDLYLATIGALMAEAGWPGPFPEAQGVRGAGPIAVRLRRWCEQHGAPLPGKTAAASRLVQDPEAISLAPGVKGALKALHAELVRVLS